MMTVSSAQIFKRGLVFGLISLYLIFPMAASAELKKIEKDTDNDGKIDRIMYVNANGVTERFEIDTNADGLMDRFQYYENGALVRSERDTDLDGIIDSKDFFKKEKRVRYERLTSSGKLMQSVDFDVCCKNDPVTFGKTPPAMVVWIRWLSISMGR